MSTGGELYLLLAIVSIVVFGLGLAYYSAQQSKLERARKPVQERAAAPAGAHAPGMRG